MTHSLYRETILLKKEEFNVSQNKKCHPHIRFLLNRTVFRRNKQKYKVDALFNRIPAFTVFIEKPLDFYHVQVDTGGYGISWSDDLDLSSDELWTNGKVIETPFDGLLSFKDASDIWNLDESTLRKAVSSKRFINGIDVCKFGKQWVVTIESMKREYGPYPIEV